MVPGGATSLKEELVERVPVLRDAGAFREARRILHEARRGAENEQLVGGENQLRSGKTYKKLWNITIFNGQIHYKWAIFHSKLLVITRG